MDSKGAAVATPTQVYEDFVPSSKLVQEQHSDTLHLILPGFKKEQMRVQLTKTGILKISGQRPIGQNKWQSAKFENGILHVKQPKLITSSVKKENEFAAKEAENSPAAKRQKTTLRDEFTKQDNNLKTSEQTEAKTLAEKKLPADESSSSSSSDSESETELTDDETTGNANRLSASLMKPKKVMKMTLVALSVLAIGLYVANVMKSANEVEE
ncbi:hypothetical protein RND71_040645 [Anisodus tanguticus]|uniref:SHSP domain-containing protein n=1 Tax=Anisodus tanguticus TaxID=243964 RepID=A0AAE1QUG0_9SOLA|nr:hypothetical protein RND71_040645 [Anisodus tanguticus]